MPERFTIMGTGPAGAESAVRCHAGSAIVLAMRWEDLGYTQVRLTDARGTAYTILAFRQRFLRLNAAAPPHPA